MATSLYLDTARLGRMSRGAQLALFDFVRLAGEEAGSLYFDEFLRHGSTSWPATMRRRLSRGASKPATGGRFKTSQFFVDVTGPLDLILAHLWTYAEIPAFPTPPADNAPASFTLSSAEDSLPPARRTAPVRRTRRRRGSRDAAREIRTAVACRRDARSVGGRASSDRRHSRRPPRRRVRFHCGNAGGPGSTAPAASPLGIRTTKPLATAEKLMDATAGEAFARRERQDADSR